MADIEVLASPVRPPYHIRLPRLVRNSVKRFNFDTWPGFAMPAVLCVYTACYGLYVLHGFHLLFNDTYAVILIPLWLVDGLRGSYEVLLRRNYKQDIEDLHKITVVIACKDGEAVIGHTLADLRKRFGGENIIVASNGSSDRTCDIVQRHGCVCLEIPDAIGKVRAIHYALDVVRTPYVLLLDDDTLIGDAPMPTGLLDQGFTAVAFRVYVKVSTWVTKFQAYEYRKSADIGKRRHNKRATVQNVSGAIGLFQLSELKRQVNLHTGEFSGEDLQRTLLIHLSEERGGVVLADSIVLTEPPATFVQLYRQRVFGWFPGLYANLGNFVRLLLKRNIPLALREDAFYNSVLVMGLDTLRLLALPIMVFYPAYFAIMYLCYVALETVTYLRYQGQRGPYWVVLLYPFYGLFGLYTRLGAFAVFLYRRSVVRISRFTFLDDYRRANRFVKSISALAIITGITAIFTLNVVYHYVLFFTNIHF